ncbi:hypothetical protein [Legionella saoudiensis]|uniref:hypothetical protein n=1 Tax=Legionella saoudiensis TaxID=1750561 RepID=UPI000730FF67|nr:hypothetical protein [Legionella saoudiensis]
MGKVNAKGMEEVKREKEEHEANLQRFMSQPFNPSNKEQLDALKKRIDDFEFTLNQMYLFQGMNTGLQGWGILTAARMFLPLPEFANYFLSAFLYLGAAGYILQKFSTTDFYNQLQEMKEIYNWALKDGKDIYDGKTNNTEKLNTPEMQRLITLLAPLCSLQFMLAWPKVTAEEEAKTGFGAVFAVGQNLYGRFFASTPDISDKLKPLQIQVENEALSIGALAGFEQSLRYFATSPYCRDLLKAKIQQPVEYVKEMIPEVITSSFSHPKMA